MGLRDTVTGAVSSAVLERPFKDKSLAEIARQLDLAGGESFTLIPALNDQAQRAEALAQLVGRGQG